MHYQVACSVEHLYHCIPLRAVLRNITPGKQHNGESCMHKTRLTRISAGAVFSERDIVPYFQPVCNLIQDCCDGAKVLMRLWHPERGLILPAGFWR